MPNTDVERDISNTDVGEVMPAILILMGGQNLIYYIIISVVNCAMRLPLNMCYTFKSQRFIV